MDHETISRKQKIELARKMAGKNDYRGRKGREEGNGWNHDEREGAGAGHFFLRILLSTFLLLAVMGVTKFDAAGDGNGEMYQKKIVKVLKRQEGLDRVKTVLSAKIS